MFMDSNSYSLPDHYNRDRLILLVQDPSNLYAYWEITSERLAMTAAYLQVKPEALQLTVRLLKREAGLVVEVARQNIDNLCGQYYFDGLSPHKTYYAEVGVPLSEGKFLAILYSEQMVLPRGGTVDNFLRDQIPVLFPPDYFRRS